MQRTRLPIRACAGSPRLLAAACFAFLIPCAATQQKLIKVPTTPPAESQPKDFRDGRYGVSFKVPAGWSLTRKDREVSTFRLDARTATRRAEMRAVASLEFNPFPQSVFSGALFYYSVERHVTDASCAAQAISSDVKVPREIQNIGGMDFTHGHDEHGGICVEARDEVYTAYRKGSCYRFDLAVNTFCAASSGAQELSQRQFRRLQEQMTTILSSVTLDWEQGGPHAVPVPHTPSMPKREPLLPGKTPAVSGGL